MKKAILMDLKDNVATLLKDTNINDQVTVFSTSKQLILELKATEAIPYGHKIALKRIEKDTPVFKFGEVVGKASIDIAVGAHVHIHNIVSTLF